MAAAAAALLVPLPAAAGPPELRCRLSSPEIAESSGIAAASWSDDVVFTHNDSGDQARFFEVDARTCALRSTYRVRGATNLDWEDMARGTARDGSAVLWLADIGDNLGRRGSVVVYEVDEPGPTEGEAGPAARDVRVRSRWTLTYPDGARDAEALLVDPETGRPVIVSKDSGGASRAYRVPASGSGALEPLARLDVRALPGGDFTSASRQVTGGATSPDRRMVVLRTYLSAWAWTASPGEPLATALARPPETLNPPLGRQPEAVTFTRDGSGLWISSEGVEAPLHRIPLVGAAPAPGTTAAPPPSDPAAAPAAADPAEPRPRRTDVLPAALAAGGVALLCTTVILVARRRRR